MINVTVWNENQHEKTDERVRSVHPNGLHETLAAILRPEKDMNVRTATLDMPECGLTEDVLSSTDVLFWWGHIAHRQVPDEVVTRVQKAVLSGMGLVVLHSGHESKIFQRLMGTSCGLRWHELGEKERIFNIAPSHPVMQGIPPYFMLEAEEMYGERFDIPDPEKLLGLCWYPSGEVFRGICEFDRGLGRIIYVQPGHETLRSYENEYIRRILINAARYAARPQALQDTRVGSAFAEPLEKI